MVPQQPPVTHFVQLGDADSMAVGLYVLCHNIHCNLAQIQIGADAGGGRDSRAVKNVQDNPGGQFPGRHGIGFQIMGHIHEHFVNRVYMDVFRCNVF